MMEDDNIGKEGPGHFTEHGDEEGEDSDSGGSNVEEEHVRPYMNMTPPSRARRSWSIS